MKSTFTKEIEGERTKKEKKMGLMGESMPSEDHHPRQHKYGLYKMLVSY